MLFYFLEKNLMFLWIREYLLGVFVYYFVDNSSDVRKMINFIFVFNFCIYSFFVSFGFIEWVFWIIEEIKLLIFFFFFDS